MSQLVDKGIVHAAGGFLLMGSWAVFANRHHPMPAPLIAGIVQGILTGTITFFLKHMIVWIVNRFQGWRALLLPVLATATVSIVLLSTVHSLAGTPEVLTTLLVPSTVATSYAALYAFRRWRMK